MAVENGLPNSYHVYTTTGITGPKHGDVDTRISNATTLTPGLFQVASPMHSYERMKQHRSLVLSDVAAMRSQHGERRFRGSQRLRGTISPHRFDIDGLLEHAAG